MDGNKTGNGPDQLRLQAWDKASGVIVYDNQAGAHINAPLDEKTVIGNGSIVVHN